MFARLTDGSRRSVEAAFEEARMLGHDSLGDEDLLLGILRADEGIAAEALSSLGVTLEDAREESEEMLSDALGSIGISLEEIRRGAGDAFEMRIPEDRKIPYSPRAKNALVGAREEMRRLGDGHLGAEHVLLGILRNADGVAVRMLRRMGVWPEALDDRLCELRGRAASSGPSSRRRKDT
jgi:ATP-dependent Clp protease ATP-binding subunit ClpC